jgi:transcriptional regulator with XRE-family HTH domain
MQGDFWRKICILLDKKGMTVQDFYECTGIARSTVNRWDRRKVTPSLSTIKLVAEALNTPVSYFLDENLILQEEVQVLKKEVDWLKGELLSLKKTSKGGHSIG